MRRPSIRKIIYLLLLWPVGAIALVVLLVPHRHRYDDSGFGFLHSSVHANINFLESDRLFFVTICGRSPKEWRWISPTNFQYRTLELEWRGDEFDGKSIVDTSLMILKHENRSIPISSASLSELLLGGPPAALKQE